MIRINHQISIPDDDIRESFVRSSGPGGQHVNKVATAVQLRFDVTGCKSLPEPVKRRLLRMAGKSVTRHGELIIAVSSNRSRERNRTEARDRLVALVRRAARKPKIHKKTRIPHGSKLKRLEAKKRRGDLKSRRHRPSVTDI